MAIPIVDSDGPISKLTLCLDIPEKKRAENDLFEVVPLLTEALK
jgi:hypothetical protein